jgi:hypothetical protein
MSRKRLLTVGAIVTAALLAACATTQPSSTDSIVQTSDEAVAGCRYLGNVSGRAAAGMTQGQDVPNSTAKARALERAAELGATHVVWYGVTGVDPTRAEGRAYECRQRPR